MGVCWFVITISFACYESCLLVSALSQALHTSESKLAIRVWANGERENTTDQAVRTGCGRNLIAATIVSTTKSTRTVICATWNGGSLRVWASPFKAGPFSTALTTPTTTIIKRANEAGTT